MDRTMTDQIQDANGKMENGILPGVAEAKVSLPNNLIFNNKWDLN